MENKIYPSIDMEATGRNIKRLREARGISVRGLADWLGFTEPQAIYKWQKGKSLPTVDNLYALAYYFEVPIEEILIPDCTVFKIADRDGGGDLAVPPFYGLFDCMRRCAA